MIAHIGAEVNALRQKKLGSSRRKLEDDIKMFFFMFEFPCIIILYYIKNQQDATLAVLFISHCKVTLHVSDAFCVHHQEY